MQLTYRGHQYQAQAPDLEISETGTTATYRGLPYSLKATKEPLESTLFELQYRGVSIMTVR